MATKYIGASDGAAFVQSFGLQFDHPAGFAGQSPFPAGQPTAATGWTSVPRSYRPPVDMRLRVLDFGVYKYGLNAYLVVLSDLPSCRSRLDVRGPHTA